MSTLCLIPNILLYGAAAVLAVREHWLHRPVASRWSMRCFRVGVIVHTAYLIALLATVGYPFFTTRGVVVNLVTWIAAVLYAVLARDLRWQAVGAWLLPFLFVFFLQAVATGPEYAVLQAALPATWVAPLHLGVAAIAVAVCLIGGVIASIAMAAAHRLKSRRPGAYWLTLPSLPRLESALTRILLIGFLALTFTISTGIFLFAWLKSPARMPFQHQWASLLAWILYGVALRARMAPHRAGQKGLAVSAIGCVVVLLSFLEAHR